MQRFGGRWTEAKLSVLKDYLEQYTKALKNQPFRLHYVDAFAGSGAYVTTQGGDAERQGSAQIALGILGFHQLHFIEKGARRCEQLRQVVNARSGAGVTVLEGDANEHLRKLCSETNWRSTRAVLFLDPYGMQVEWETLQLVAKTGAIDVWYLFPLSGVTRQLTVRESKMDADKKRSLDRVFGTASWREAFYDVDPMPDLFGQISVQRHADSAAIVRWVTGRLEGIFPVVVGPQVLHRGAGGKASGGPPLFALYFLAASQSPKAQGVAKAIANGVLKKLQREVESHV